MKSTGYSNKYRFAYKVSDKAALKVEYFNGKADSFDFDIPFTGQFKDPQETLNPCNLNLKIEDAEQNSHGLHWIEKNGDKKKFSLKVLAFTFESVTFLLRYSVSLSKPEDLPLNRGHSALNPRSFLSNQKRRDFRNAAFLIRLEFTSY